MSLINLLKKKIKIDLFTTPSHAQKFFIFNKFRQFYKYDVSETDAHDPQVALKAAQEKAAKIYGTKSTYFLINGSSSGIIAAVLSCVNNADKVLVWDNAHPSHANAVKLAHAEPVFYSLEKDTEWDIYTNAKPEIIEKHLKTDKIKAVIVTSPTYEGVVSDIKAIKEVCKKSGAYLIVDEAHGALYPFCDKLPQSAIYQGADFIIQSLHKTAGGLNPTALLHSNTDLDVQAALDLFTTTSPSYPLLMTIEKNVIYLNSKKGKNLIIELIKNIEIIKSNLPHCDFYCGDLTKILVKFPNMAGSALSEFLYKHGIEDERANEKSVLLLSGIGTDFKKLKRLESVLKKINKAS